MSNVSLLLNKCMGLNKCINEQWEEFKPYCNKSSAGTADDAARPVHLSLVCPSSISFRKETLKIKMSLVSITIASLKPHFDKVNNTFNDPLPTDAWFDLSKARKPSFKYMQFSRLCRRWQSMTC